MSHNWFQCYPFTLVKSIIVSLIFNIIYSHRGCHLKVIGTFGIEAIAIWLIK